MTTRFKQAQSSSEKLKLAQVQLSSDKLGLCFAFDLVLVLIGSLLQTWDRSESWSVFQYDLNIVFVLIWSWSRFSSWLLSQFWSWFLFYSMFSRSWIMKCVDLLKFCHGWLGGWLCLASEFYEKLSFQLCNKSGTEGGFTNCTVQISHSCRRLAGQIMQILIVISEYCNTFQRCNIIYIIRRQKTYILSSA